MPAARSVYELGEASWNRLQGIVERFEKHCGESFPRNIDDYLPPPNDPLRGFVLAELICADLEMHWHLRQPRHVEFYLERYPELHNHGCLPELLYNEFLIRHRLGDRPQVSEYQTRFPQYHGAFQQLVGAKADAKPTDDASVREATSVDAGPARQEDTTTRKGCFARWQGLKNAKDGTLRYRPVQRMVQPTLVVFDDEGLPGERIVLRQPKFRIGRSEGELLLAHDMLVSGRHATLMWKHGSLTLVDEGSRNGTFWRLRTGQACRLVDGDRFLCGNQLFQFNRIAAEPATNDARSRSRDAPDSAAQRALAKLTRLGERGETVRELVLQADCRITIGRDPKTTIAVADPFLSPRHARVRNVSREDVWLVEDLASLNGVFLRIRGPIRLSHGDMFRVGEQLIGVLFPLNLSSERNARP
jgi:pSer/pThr/pTyr-binding forkhead associated (FHA) protein